MSTDFSIPIIGGDEELIQQLVADKVKQKRKQAQSQPVQPSAEHRAMARYDVTMPVVCFPLLPSLEVNSEGRIDGIVVDISEEGIGLNVAAGKATVGDSWLLAVEVDNVGWQFANIQIVGSRRAGAFQKVHGKFEGPFQKLFSFETLWPKLNKQYFRYEFAYSDAVLTSLSAIGAIQRVVMDEALCCPDCLALPTVRRGCSICLSNETEQSKMIHHFACAHVDFIDQFDQGEEIMCPKCLGRKMIVGADYEYLEGPVQCRECGHNDLEEIMIGHCLHCSSRFPFDNAVSIEVLGYRVNRLDPLALIN